ncbi:MAG: DinB family protein [Anaerolineae bacterium]|nr:DinB family protein [Anaerolineae bacterium]
MPHPLVTQLRFARREFARCFEGVPLGDTRRRLDSLNCLSWIVGHLANQEHFFWVQAAQGQNIASDLAKLVGSGQPASIPPWEEMWGLWQAITRVADRYLDTLTSEMLHTHLQWQGQPLPEDVGTLLLRNIYHYWFHLGEAHAIRQMLGHIGLPEFVGEMTGVCYNAEE